MGISTHILDTTLGRPAAGVMVSLCFGSAEKWALVRTAATDPDGRCKQLHPESEALIPGFYRIRFETAAYFSENQLTGLYPYVDIVFQVLDGKQHYHIPLLLTANSYTTYRGS